MIFSLLVSFGVTAQERFDQLSRSIQNDGEQAMHDYLNSGANPAYQSLHNGITPLMLAVDTGNSSIVSMVLDTGVDPEVYDEFGNTALIRSVAGRFEHIATLLLERGANIHACDKGGNTSLMYSVHLLGSKYLASIDKLLIENGIDANGSNQYGETPLLRAVRGAFLKEEDVTVEIINRLLRAGAYINVQDNRGNTALHIAVESYKPFLITQCLIKNGAILDIPDKQSNTALMRAIIFGAKNTYDYDDIHKSDAQRIAETKYYSLNIDIIKALVESGADIHWVNHAGKSAVTLAEESKVSELIDLLCPDPTISEFQDITL